MKPIVIAGIGTAVGKTVISAIVTEALKADYWKPIQAGDLDNSDTDSVKRLISNSQTTFYPERYRLNSPMSPHAAARIDNIEIDPRELHLPDSTKHLVIELAGGLMVPLNQNTLNLDLLKTWKAPVILVSKNYLGSINHTLLSLAALQTQKIPVAGILFNGEKNKSSEDFILNYSHCACLGSVETLTELNYQTIKAAAEILKPALLKLF